MLYTVECYKHTGFNSVNIPESLSWLRSNFKAVSFPAIDILQDEGLTSVQIKATWAEARDIDYCVIHDEAYAATAVPSMTSPDVTTLNLVEDPLTSCGGAANLIYLDGVTDRHTVDDDTLFKYTQDDPLLAPREALILDCTNMLFDNSGEVVATPVESTIDLVKLGSQFDSDGNFKGVGLTFNENINGVALTDPVTVPYTEGVSARTMFVIGDATEGPLSPNTRLYEERSSGTEMQYPLVSRGLAAVRSLGVESALISQVAYPSAYIEVQIGSDGQYSFVRGKDQTVESGLNFVYDDTIKNKRVFYGSYASFGLVSASGAKGEYLPEQIGDASDKSPSIRSIADPRPSGKPYFRFLKYKGNAGDTSFWISCISGLTWANVPLTYTKASGSYMNELNFRNGAESAGSEYQYNYHQNSSIGNLAKAVPQTISDVATSGVRWLVHTFGGGIQGGAYSAGVDPSSPYYHDQLVGADVIPNKYAFDYGNQRYTLDQYKLARAREMQNFAVGQSVVAPTVLFPFNADMIRDFVGNGVICYRYRYTSNDLQRVDKLLTMFGYKDTVPLDGSLFKNRTNFDFVSASGVSIGGDSIPMWKRELIADQLSAGVRVWHVKPDVSCYTNNPIRSAS